MKFDTEIGKIVAALVKNENPPYSSITLADATLEVQELIAFRRFFRDVTEVFKNASQNLLSTATEGERDQFIMGIIDAWNDRVPGTPLEAYWDKPYPLPSELLSFESAFVLVHEFALDRLATIFDNSDEHIRLQDALNVLDDNIVNHLGDDNDQQ